MARNNSMSVLRFVFVLIILTFFIDKAIAFHGKQSLCITVSSRNLIGKLYAQSFPEDQNKLKKLKENQYYTLSAYLRSNKSKFPVLVIIKTNNKVYKFKSEVSHFWKREIFTFYLKGKLKYICIYPLEVGKLWIDAVKLEKGKKATRFAKKATRFALSSNYDIIYFSKFKVKKKLAGLRWKKYREGSKMHNSDLPVFPGAEGFGTKTPAGRGGIIVKVTNLNSDGPGSLRYAVSIKKPRIVVFEVSGTIELHRNLVIEYPYITIAGQTAPSPGITIKGAGISIRTHDVLIQHIRVRVGDEDNGPGFDNRDALYIEDVPRQNDVYNIVIDHCSFSWAVDENVSLWYPTVHDVTISNCIISEALDSPKHPKGPHSKGIIVGPGIKNVSFIRNLLVSNKQRNPYLREGSSVVFVNNIVYNYGSCVNLHGDPKFPILASIVGNAFIPGPNSTNIEPIYSETPLSCDSKLFIRFNWYWPLRSYTNNHPCQISRIRVLCNSVNLITKNSPPIWIQPLTVYKINKNLIHKILLTVGARPADRDLVDKRIIKEVKLKKGRIIASQKEVGGWPILHVKRRKFKIPKNPNRDDDRDGYTNIEELLFKMAQQLESKGRQ